MSLIKSALGNINEVQEKLLGPNYEYWKQVKMPVEMNMSGEGSIRALARNINGLINYVDLLVAGSGRGSKTGGPMGNKFFLKTGAKCKDIATDKKVDRYIYVNNVPDGNIPFISQGLGGVSFSNFRGLIPGALGSLNTLNPFSLLQAFTMGNTPECQHLTMETIDANNNKANKTHHVAKPDIMNMNPCWFSGGKNPLTNESCKRTFQSMFKEENSADIPDDLISILFISGVSGLSLYILYCLMMKNNKK
jgi:hypothetical protein